MITFAQVVILVLLQRLCHDFVNASARYEKCNETILVGDLTDLNSATLTLKMEKVRKADRGKALYCWFRFEGAPGQFIQVDVKDIRAGIYDGSAHSCDKGYLRISDRESCSTKPDWLPPTTICGSYTDGQVRVKRLTRSPVAFVEFKLDKAKTTLGYEFDVTFLNADAENQSLEVDENLPYGDLQRIDGKIQNTKCDWLIPVETCHEMCEVVSPGFPGIYPPNTRCRYLLTNFEDDRVELRLGGKGFRGKFDLKRSANCTEDSVAVYDGSSTLHPLIGRFCGQDGEFLVSSGPSLLMIFETGPGGPPWDYSGFSVQTTYRWKSAQDGGKILDNSVCNWIINSDDTEEGEGDVHTPDHKVENNTQCLYTFQGRYNEKIELDLTVTQLDSDCAEYIEIIENDKQLDKLCSDRLTKRRNEFQYSSSSSTLIVKYYTTEEKVSSPSPTWINFKFVNNPDVKGPPPVKSELGTDESEPEASGVVGGTTSIYVISHLISQVVLVLSTLVIGSMLL